MKKREEIEILVSQYALFHILNMDATCLFYRIEPNYTLATKMFRKKKEKECIIIALIANVDSTIKFLSLVINKHVKL